MELKSAITERRSVRKYYDTPVANEDIKDILENAMWAPSGTNMQPWYFVAVNSADKVNKIKEIMQEVKRQFAPVLAQRFDKYPEVQKETLSFIETLGGAPTVILAFMLKEYPEQSVFPCEQSVAAAVQNILLLAHEKGLKTCWLTAPMMAKAELEKEFGSGKGGFMGMITLGYGEQPQKAPPRKENRYEII